MPVKRGQALMFGDPAAPAHQPIKEDLADTIDALRLDDGQSVSFVGAVGDGSTDDTSAFQSAIDELPSGGGTIILKDGSNYSLTARNLDMDGKDILWRGAGATVNGGTKWPLPGTVHRGRITLLNDMEIYPTLEDMEKNVAQEIVVAVVGDDTSSVTSAGSRRGLEIGVETNKTDLDWNSAGGNDGEGELSAGILLRTDNGSGARMRNGILIDERVGEISTAIRVITHGPVGIRLQGDNSIAHVLSSGEPDNGVILNGTYSGSAVRIKEGEKLSLNSSSTVYVKYEDSVEMMAFYRGSNSRLKINMNGVGNVPSPISLNFSGTLKEVTEGAADSAGAGFRTLRVPN